MPRRAHGYAYLALLFAVALIGAGLGVAAEIWHTQAQREREQQLLWVGHQYRRAIEQYWRAGANAGAPGASQGGGANAAGATAGGSAVPGAAGAQGATNPGDATPGVTGDAATTDGGNPAGAPGSTPFGGVATGANGSAPGPGGPGSPAAANPLSTGLNSPLSSGLGTISGGPSRFPATLADLLSDKRSLQVRRFLRTLYVDPMTGKADWILVRAPTGGIMGVRSASLDPPFKIAGFVPADQAFTGRKRYTDWIFQFLPPGASQARSGGVQNPSGALSPGGFGNASGANGTGSGGTGTGTGTGSGGASPAGGAIQNGPGTGATPPADTTP